MQVHAILSDDDFMYKEGKDYKLFVKLHQKGATNM